MNQNYPNQKYLLLAEKWASGTITQHELEEYINWLKETDPEASLEIPAKFASDKESHRLKLYDQIRRKAIDLPTEKTRNNYGKLFRAAAVIAGISLSGYLAFLYFTPQKNQSVAVTHLPVVTDIQAGTNGAVLKLANGKVIVLDTAADGNLDNNVMKSQQAIVFDAKAGTSTVEYNTLSTPRARQQQLVLPDGSRIWLNAESSIRFPTRFTGKTREIDITGEAYFEIASDKSKPFIVNVNQSSIVVTGTSFNVMAYDNEKELETTLLEGRVHFRNNGNEMLLQPGQQSRLSRDQQLRLVRSPDLELVMAWKNGFQSFKNAGIETILRQITRWYDVDVEVNGKAPDNMSFSGEIPREVTLMQLLKALESKQLHFALDAPNKKLRVQFDAAQPES